ncbi:hypothetical protein BU23DRAFT_581235 [Bimuria novae-zelandiae CBS 107.79]|uniref:DNA recombination and repair protein Rad51-like C-terminal domain-containing protein n=1 Tax=Bimuria novae-zelandiae CBS 107.79 TaxID=1447943 RepID=A0A6A5V6X7_9PLEO|nr:hypothetical protein BU23DRAFT_581235 [Bimuria novae-zelandiae CBS 107.79]
MADAGGAERLGARLLGEVEECALSERGIHVLELVSPPCTHHPSPAGKTSLLHLIITHAILPASLSCVPLSSQNAAVILFDPLHRFSVPFLARTLFAHLTSALTTAGQDLTSPTLKNEVTHCVKTALAHVHIFRPSSWAALLATLRSLETYLFDGTRHTSSHRAIRSLVLDDIDAFIPSIRSTSSAIPSGAGANPLTAASTQLTFHVEKLATLLSCAVVTTSRSPSANAFHALLPMSWPAGMQVTRVAVRRVEVLKFAPWVSVEEAEGERGQRWEVVSRGRFEAWKVGVGREGEGFVFRVGDGVRIEREGGG